MGAAGDWNNAAGTQTNRIPHIKLAKSGNRYELTDLRLFAVVGIGLERVVWQGVGV